MNYVVDIKQPMDLRLNPEEHSEWLQANEDQVDALLTTPAMNKVLRDSFEYSKTNSIF